MAGVGYPGIEIPGWGLATLAAKSTSVDWVRRAYGASRMGRALQRSSPRRRTSRHDVPPAGGFNPTDLRTGRPSRASSRALSNGGGAGAHHASAGKGYGPGTTLAAMASIRTTIGSLG